MAIEKSLKRGTPEYTAYQLKRAIGVATERHGKCLTEIYTGVKSKMLWKCAVEDHPVFPSTFNDIVNVKHWCPKCGLDYLSEKFRDKDNLIIAKKYAQSKNGYCLSSTYKNMRQPLIWKCHIPEHPEWKSSFDAIVNKKSWCGKCDGQNVESTDQLLRAHAYAKEREGQCLTFEYVRASDDFFWKCNDPNHPQWKSSFNNVVNGRSWCAICDGQKFLNDQRLTEAKNYAISKGGHCISDCYINNHLPLKWKCGNPNHDAWERSFVEIVNAEAWCKYCSQGMSERIHRRIAEILLSCIFSKIKPDWLKNPKTGRNLELDGFNCEFLVAFETQGPQHFKSVNWFGSKRIRDDCNFESIQERDAFKMQVCLERGIRLIEIDTEMPLVDVPQFMYDLWSLHDDLRLRLTDPSKIDTKALYTETSENTHFQK